MHLFHIATAADWSAARTSGRYTTSTRGRTLAQEGFIHASRSDQWQGVRARYYADVTEPLVLLVIDSARLGSPVVEETVGAGVETFPHVYGPIEADAVLRALPLEHAAAELGRSFTSVFVGEMVHRVALALVVMTLAVVGLVVGGLIDDRVGPLLGILAGAVVAAPVVWALHRRRARRAGEL